MPLRRPLRARCTELLMKTNTQVKAMMTGSIMPSWASHIATHTPTHSPRVRDEGVRGSSPATLPPVGDWAMPLAVVVAFHPPPIGDAVALLAPTTAVMPAAPARLRTAKRVLESHTRRE